MRRPTTVTSRLDPASLLALTGWHLEDRGACRGDVCVPLPAGAATDAESLATALGVGLAHDRDRGLWAIGPDARQHALADAQLPDIELRTRDGAAVALRSLIGGRGVVVAWASWCGCRTDLPVWQDMHDEFAAHGVSVTLVALDTPEAAAPHLEPLRDDGPLALVDTALLTVEALGWVNVPSAVWYDESGTIVRGPEVAFVKPKRDAPVPDDATAEQREYLGYVNAFPHAGATWLDALRDWVAHGPSSAYALAADEVIARSRSFGIDGARASAQYALGEHLRAAGDQDGAVEHLRRAHELDPEQWNRKRQAWALAGGPQRFDTSILAEMRVHGPASFYPPVELQ